MATSTSCETATPFGPDPGLVLDQELLYGKVASEFAAPLARLARAHEADPSTRQDLLQEIHVALWRSLTSYEQRCSLRTWVYRVAHNVAANHILRSRRRQLHKLVGLEEIETMPDGMEIEAAVDESRTLERLTRLIQKLRPLDRELIILHLEGLSTDEIAEIAGLSLASTTTKIHRARQLLVVRVNARELS
jgi:RNA polymerase sigma-70 factor (ECF subfamily)